MAPAVAALNLALVLQIVSNYRLRAAINAAKGEEAGSSGWAAGITTVFNALT